MSMGLTEAKRLFDVLRVSDSKIFVTGHAHRDHRSRGFSVVEIVRLIRGKGVLRVNHAATAKPGSFVWHCKDEIGRACELTCLFEVLENGQVVVVVSAWR